MPGLAGRYLSGLSLFVFAWLALPQLAASPSLPHLLFYGPSGGGKKTRVMALLRELFGEGVDKVGGYSSGPTTLKRFCPCLRAVGVVRLSSAAPRGDLRGRRLKRRGDCLLLDAPRLA